MTQQNVYNKYNQSKILTATPAQLTLMLYDGSIKFCNIAIAALENNDIETAHKNIIKVQNIITEFRSTLDFKYPVARDFENVYSYIYDRSVEANIKKDKDILIEVLGHLKTMRDTWKEVMELNKNK